jgi:lipid-binding SYLF domain-containing protein
MLIALIVPTTPIFAQATGQVRVKIMKAGLLVGGGAGKGVLTYRGRNYPFRVSGLSLGVTVGASFGRLEGWASGIREISDFAGTYNSVGGGAALAGGINGAQLRNDKGVTMVLQGPKAGLEFAANLSTIMISLK